MTRNWLLIVTSIAMAGVLPGCTGSLGGADADVSDATEAEVATDAPIDDDAASDAHALVDGPVADMDLGIPVIPADWCVTGDTVLARAVQSMSAGDWAEMPHNDSLDALVIDGHLTSWSDTGVWNPVRRRVQWVGGPGTCCANPAAYKLIEYDVATDSWKVLDTPWLHNPGHAYDGSALDPATGLHYFARGGDDIRAWDGSTWSDSLPKAPFRGVVAAGLTWFRDLNQGRGALIHVGPTNNVGAFDGSDWEVPERSIEGWGGYHMFGEYNPVHQVVWLGSGKGGEQKHAKLNADLELVQLEEAPIDLQGSGRAQKTYDPRSGKYIVYRKDDVVDVWYEYDIIEDTWKDITRAIEAKLPASWSDGGHRFVVPIDDCGVLWFWAHRNDNRRVYLYKHSE